MTEALNGAKAGNPSASVVPLPESGIRTAWRQAIKELIWWFSRPGAHRRGRDICIFSTRRSGSTWFMEVLASARGVTYCDQPIGVRSASLNHLSQLPLRDDGILVDLRPEDEPILRA